MAGIASVDLVSRADHQRLVLVTLTDGLAETFVVTTSEDGRFETWSTQNGDTVATVDLDRGPSDAMAVLGNLLITEIVANAGEALATLGIDPSGLTADERADALASVTEAMQVGLDIGAQLPTEADLRSGEQQQRSGDVTEVTVVAPVDQPAQEDGRDQAQQAEEEQPDQPEQQQDQQDEQQQQEDRYDDPEADANAPDQQSTSDTTGDEQDSPD